VRVDSVRVTSTGPALGEVVTEGSLIDPAKDEVLATFRQRFRAWLGRPVLEMRIEIDVVRGPQGHPWQAYYGARFAWRDERAVLLRGAGGTGFVTSHARPDTASYLELRHGRHGTLLFPGGLPFHQRHGSRMLDVILVSPGETARTFDLGLGIDREYPMLMAQGLVSPAPLVPTTKGPPHVGATGWLFHLDAPNLLLTSIRPAPDGADGVIARLLECSGNSGQATLRCARDPVRAELQDARGSSQLELSAEGDAVTFDVSPSELFQVRADFG
jgi:hypothetical protein